MLLPVPIRMKIIVYTYLKMCSHRHMNIARRKISSNVSGSTMNIFDRKTKCLQRDRAALAVDVSDFDYLKDEVGYRLADRVFDIKRNFPIVVDLGCGRGHVSKNLTEDVIGNLIQCESSFSMLQHCSGPDLIPTTKVLLDEEKLPFRDNSIDLFLSNLSLHWVNNLPLAFLEIQRCLKNDGVLIASVFGGDTLFELRCSLQLAEIEQEGGFAPHVSPFTDVRDLGGLLTRAGFNMLTIDSDEIIVNYPSIYELMWDLKGMAENNAAWSRKNHLHRDSMLAAAAIYQNHYGNKDGTIPATFQIIYFIGWKPDGSQAKPAARGSATVSLKDLETIMKVKGNVK